MFYHLISLIPYYTPLHQRFTSLLLRLLSINTSPTFRPFPVSCHTYHHRWPLGLTPQFNPSENFLSLFILYKYSVGSRNKIRNRLPLSYRAKRTQYKLRFFDCTLCNLCPSHGWPRTAYCSHILPPLYLPTLIEPQENHLATLEHLKRS
jgi:hypothetical protein